jgi:acetyl esterase/lipase
MIQQTAGAAEPWPNNIDPSTDTRSFLLWENGAPGALGDTDDDKPSLTLFPARGASGATTAVIIAPGGSYARLAANHEGRQVANWFNSLGVTAFVLRYRLGPRYHHPVEMGDAQRAIRFVRAHAEELGIRGDRVGFMGFSAGGHLASTVATHFDAGNAGAQDPVERMGSRPDFVVLAYPVITMTADYGHKLSALLRMRIRLCRRRTALRFIWRYGRRECRRRFMCLNLGGMVWGWLPGILCWGNGRCC